MLFQNVKAVVTIRMAAERYGLTVRRNHMTCCPFHHDRHPSMKLNENYFYCFGCGAHGDVIDFVARFFHLTSYEAARKLEHDFSVDPEKPPATAARQKPQRTVCPQVQRCQQVLCAYLHLLECWKVQYAPLSPDDPLDDHFVEACQMLDSISYLADILSLAPLEVRTSTVDELCKDGAMDKLEERLQRLQKEVKAYHESEIA